MTFVKEYKKNANEKSEIKKIVGNKLHSISQLISERQSDLNMHKSVTQETLYRQNPDLSNTSRLNYASKNIQSSEKCCIRKNCILYVLLALFTIIVVVLIAVILSLFLRIKSKFCFRFKLNKFYQFPV
jgi:hypothetical protein